MTPSMTQTHPREYCGLCGVSSATANEFILEHTHLGLHS